MNFKKIFSALSIAGILSIAGCSAAPETADMTQISDTAMPSPFEYSDGDQNDSFYHPCIAKFDNIIDLVYDLAHDSAAFQTWAEEMNQIETPCRIDEYVNIYSFMLHFNISADDVCAALQEYNGMQEQWQDERGIPINSTTYYSEEDLEALKSGDMATVTEHFASEYSIVVGDNIYSPNWIYYHTADDYTACGITADEIKAHTDQYSEINLEADALSAFESKISDYIGETVSLARENTD